MTPRPDPIGDTGRPRSTRSDGGEDLRRGPADAEFRILAATPEPGTDEESGALAAILEAQEQLLRRVNDNRAILMEILRRLEREEAGRIREEPPRHGAGSSAFGPRSAGGRGLTGLSDSGVDDYDLLVARVRTLVRAVIPAESTVLVVSRGDDELLRLDGRRAWHFPSSAAGEYAGYHPADDEEAIAHLAGLLREGAEYLVVPRTAFWWLEHYPRFRAHLEANGQVVARDETACVVLSLGSPNGDPHPTKESW